MPLKLLVEFSVENFIFMLIEGPIVGRFAYKHVLAILNEYWTLGVVQLKPEYCVLLCTVCCVYKYFYFLAVLPSVL